MLQAILQDATFKLGPALAMPTRITVIIVKIDLERQRLGLSAIVDREIYNHFNPPDAGRAYEPNKDATAGAVGFGMLMVDPPDNRQQLWHWRDNVDDGVNRMDGYRAEAADWIFRQVSLLIVALRDPNHPGPRLAFYDRKGNNWRWLESPFPEFQLQALGTMLLFQETLPLDRQGHTRLLSSSENRQFVLTNLAGAAVATWSAPAHTEILLIHGDTLIVRRGGAIFASIIRDKQIVEERQICEDEALEDVHWAVAVEAK